MSLMWILPPGAVLSDQLFAYGTLLLLVGLIVWHARTSSSTATGS